MRKVKYKKEYWFFYFHSTWYFKDVNMIMLQTLTDDSESYTHSRSIQFVTQRSWSHSWKRKSFRHQKDVTHVERMHSCKRLQSASSHMRRIILLKSQDNIYCQMI